MNRSFHIKPTGLPMSLRTSPHLQNPVIVDENHVVLDGNHRTHVFKMLNFRYIPVCKIDYLNDNTKLRCWFRLLGHIPNIDTIKKAFESSGCRTPSSSRQISIDGRPWRPTRMRAVFNGTDGFLFIEFPRCLVTRCGGAYSICCSKSSNN